MADLARTSTDPDERSDFFEHEAGCRERGVTIGTDWAEMRISENAWFRFARAARRAAARFRVHGGRPQKSLAIYTSGVEIQSEAISEITFTQ